MLFTLFDDFLAVEYTWEFEAFVLVDVAGFEPENTSKKITNLLFVVASSAEHIFV